MLFGGRFVLVLRVIIISRHLSYVALVSFERKEREESVQYCIIDLRRIAGRRFPRHAVNSSQQFLGHR